MANQQSQDKIVWGFDPIPFNNMVETQFTDSHTFCKQIVYPIFSEMWPDFYGSKIEVGQNRYIGLTFFFAEKEDYPDPDSDKVPVIERILGNQRNMDINDKIKRINNLYNSPNQNKLRLTAEGKQMLAKLVPYHNGKINWNGISREGAFDNRMLAYPNSNEGKPYIQVSMDINRVVRTIYGAKSKDGEEEYQYLVLLGNPINPIQTYGGALIAKQWQLFIIRADKKAIGKLADKYGMSTDNLDIIRG